MKEKKEEKKLIISFASGIIVECEREAGMT